VEVEGSFDNWTTRQPLQHTGKDWTIIKLLPPGVYQVRGEGESRSLVGLAAVLAMRCGRLLFQDHLLLCTTSPETSSQPPTLPRLRKPLHINTKQYKFIVDGDWRYDPNQPAMYDEMSNVNNVIEVQEYVPENLDNVSGFEPPPSPPSSYANPAPAAEDYAKEPPLMPPHLQLTLLNVPPADSGASLPRPQHVILGHLYLQRGQVGVGVGVLFGRGAMSRGLGCLDHFID